MISAFSLRERYDKSDYGLSLSQGYMHEAVLRICEEHLQGQTTILLQF